MLLVVENKSKRKMTIMVQDGEMQKRGEKTNAREMI